MITQHIDAMQIKIDQEQGNKQEQAVTKSESVYYASVAFLQSTDDTSKLDELKEKGDYKELLTLAKEYYDGNSIDGQYIHQTACTNRGDDVLVEDEDFAVVYNNSVGGTYEVLLKQTEQDVRDYITRYGIDQACDEVKEVAKKMANEEFTALTSHKQPIFQMPNDAILNFQYNKEKDCLDVGTVTNAGLAVKHSFPYEHNLSLDVNIQGVYEQLTEMDEYKQEEHVAKSVFHR